MISSAVNDLSSVHVTLIAIICELEDFTAIELELLFGVAPYHLLDEYFLVLNWLREFAF